MSRMYKSKDDSLRVSSPDFPSDPSDDDCGDVDELMVISSNLKLKDHLQDQSKDTQIKSENKTNEISIASNHPIRAATQAKPEQDRTLSYSSLSKTIPFNPENVKDFNVAYKQLAKRLCKEEGGDVMVPDQQLQKIQNEKPLDFDDIQKKVQGFQDRKRYKIQLLKETLEQRELEECRFAPTLSARKSRRGSKEARPLEKFLEDQSKFQESKQLKLLERTQEKEKQMMSQTVKPSYINPQSVKLLHKKGSRQNSEMRDEYTNRDKASQKTSRRGSSVMKSSQANQETFKPMINQNSRDLVRSRPVAEMLYEDALKRKTKLLQIEKSVYDSDKTKSLNPMHMKYLLQRFDREFKTIIEQVLQVSEPVECLKKRKLSYLKFKEAMVMLGFTTKSQLNTKNSKERGFLYEMWKLSDSKDDEMSVDDLRAIILAILKISDGSRVQVSSNPDSEIKDVKNVGFRDQRERLCFSQEDVETVSKEFNSLLINRKNFQAQLKQQRKGQQGEQPSFKPLISKESLALAQKNRQKIAESIQVNKIQTFELLSAANNKDAWIDNARQILQQEEMRECTFKPQIRCRQDSICSRKEQDSCQKDATQMDNSSMTNQEERRPSKIRSRDLMPQTGDKFNDLYLQAVNMQRFEKKDRTTEEIEFDRAKKDLTFAPKVQKRQPSRDSRHQKVTEDHWVKKEIERLEKGRREKERIKQMTERGIILKNNSNQKKVKKCSSSQKENQPLPKAPEILDKNQDQDFIKMKEDLRDISNIQSQPNKDISRQNETPLLYIDVNLGDNEAERLVVFQGDQPRELARKFCEEHELDEGTMQLLEEQIQRQITNMMAVIEEENE